MVWFQQLTMQLLRAREAGTMHGLYAGAPQRQRPSFERRNLVSETKQLRDIPDCDHPPQSAPSKCGWILALFK